MSLEEGVSNMANAYMYSKVSSEMKAWDYMQKKKPVFDLIVLLVPSIIGRGIQEGFVPNKDSLGGMSSIYRDLFDRDSIGFIFPYFM